MAITQRAHDVLLCSITRQMLANSADVVSTGETEDSESFDLMAGVRVIPITDYLAYSVPESLKCYGISDLKDIRESIEEAANNASVNTIVLAFNSPGGELTGLYELSDYIQTVAKTKNCIAYCETQACSAAFLLFLACNEYYATPSAELGSVGIICTGIDSSKLYEMNGLKVKQFVGGKYKGMYAEGVSMTDAQEAFVQSGVMKSTEEFRQYVKSRMPTIPDEMMEGQVILAKDLEQYGVTLVSCPEEIFQ